MHHRTATALVLGAALTAFPSLLPGSTQADEEPVSVEELVVEMANTPGDHAAVAKYFRAKAAEARAEANRHRSMGRVYTGGKLHHRSQMESHCRKLTAQSNAMADEYDALAKLHDEEAKQP